jgi:perosamine synthetase
VFFPLLENKKFRRTPTLGIFSPVEEAQHLFRFIKSPETLEALWNRSVAFQVPQFMDFRLLPIGEVHKDDEHLIELLALWRNDYYHLYPSQSEITNESTHAWLRNAVLDNKDRVLFLVIDKYGNYHGHLGLWIRDQNRFEIDNVLKARSSRVKGLFSAAVKTLGNWANEYTGVERLTLRVLKSNEHAVDFYKALDLQVEEEIAIKWTKSLGKLELIAADEQDATDAWLVMSIQLEKWNSIPELILTAGPSMGPFEVSLVSDAVKTGWNNHHSDYINEFTEVFAEYVGSKYAIPTDSCTSALHLAMWALGIGPGDEVIVPEVTWVATANAVKYVGATPVFADINPNTWTIDPKSAEKLITSRTKAIIPVHLYGYVADLSSLEDLCSKHNLSLVQDAAPGIGSMYGNQGVATRGDFSCFSFQGAKLLVSGEGGVITTNNPDLYAKAFKIGDSGRRPGTFWIEILGKKMKMSNVTAALALAQLQSAERQIAKKRLIRDWYQEEFRGFSELSIQEEMIGSRSICWLTSLHINREGFMRDEFRQNLFKNGVDTRPVFSPISQYPIWGEQLIPKTHAFRIGENSINLPSGVGLSRASVAKVGEQIRTELNLN